MRLRTADDIDVRGKRVILRATLDVHYIEQDGKRVVKDDARLQEIVPSVRSLVSRGAKVILLSWLQRPEGMPVETMNMQPVAERLSQLLGQNVLMLPDCFGMEVRKMIDEAPAPSVMLLENVRFHLGEKDTKVFDIEYARELAKNGDIFINDAFGQSHRNVASITGIPRFLPSYAGSLLIKEVKALESVLTKPARPFVAVIGGAKISTKIGVIQSLLQKVDSLLLGGALANTILRAQGVQIGTSLVEEGMVEVAKSLKLTDNRLHIPIDVVTAKDLSPAAATRTSAVGKVFEDEKILDIGPDTIKLFEKVLATAQTVIWNGPMGYFELPQFTKGTDDIARAVAGSGAHTVAGGGETIDAIRRLGLEKKISFISMGGGAMLDFLEAGTLPGIEVLRES
ncbi:MAG: phosphoglycerate kinase [Candidatus Kerfeldbacteria bacterium RIFCSPLOWO2_01_FULL_48_11]|uniref:Phosphoglycerate kinase n=1 Tax=Candidatus Kerfeldbacteria bacterium RIFCSPLOWO2_01_FULL_48_11 TaxID=1798543 RepID=A0A1G2B515_9BACT|nr:MAG: Phosphoglycerate kinase [Parcubacteria group bacterium GW2011_GWC2_49_9]OGY84281.1 MAG: phosphoglycerate kinase [Candidatus Kerfeldbacteria bacterium RIFCSPLOWO2_01_FULL_48_11]HCJ52949.1 phosphoglycerate kinase [Candidatus Kerfeldbacteria bacterium]